MVALPQDAVGLVEDRPPLGKARLSPRLMLVSDLDNTMVDHQDPTNEALLRFGALWAAEYSHDSFLVYSTGRSPSRYHALKEQRPLLTPDILIMSVGTEIVEMHGSIAKADQGWQALLDKSWDRHIVVEEARAIPDVIFQAESEQRMHKVSFSVDKAQAQSVIDVLGKKLRERGLQVKLIYSGGRDLDVLPEGAGKGGALAYLLGKYAREGRTPGNTLACGDSGNDAELFEVEGAHGVIVGNAMEELVKWHSSQPSSPRIFRATERCASGVIQAMQHFKFLPAVSPRDKPAASDEALQGGEVRQPLAAVQREVVDVYIFLERWLAGQIEFNEETIHRLSLLMAEDFTEITPDGRELSREDWIEDFRETYGSLRGRGLRLWIDRMHGRQLSSGLWLVRCQTCQQVEGKPREVRLASAILGAKAGLPNGVEWLHAHFTHPKKAPG